MNNNHTNNPTAVLPRDSAPDRDPNRTNHWAQRLIDVFGEKSDSNLDVYAELAEQASDEILEKALDEALAPPAYRIRKTRGHLFRYLVKKALEQASV